MAYVEGQRLGRYTLLRRLGRGGGGEAWEAVLNGPHGFARRVAIKLLSEGHGEGALDDLVREARLGALLHHPNLVATYELSEAEGVLFLAMELVQGTSVRELVSAVHLPGGVVVDIGAQTCAGLQHLHRLEVDGRPGGLVHRDLKPANLLVDHTGLVKVADFGISRGSGVGGRPTGTPGYSPPEQGDGAQDARSDLFALGATLYAIATRRSPFGKGVRVTAELAARRLADPAFLAEADAKVPGLGPVLARCLAPDPDDRWPTAEALGHALAALRARQAPGPTLRELMLKVAPHATAGGGPDSTPVADEPTVLVRGNLPGARDRFVGRQEVPVVLGLLAEGHPLVTLLGPGGMGKTRLSLEVARRWTEGGSGSGWFFDLADARDAEAVCRTVAAGLSVELGGEGDLAERLGHALRALGRTLVVLDNLEQVVEPASRVIARWRTLAPEVAFLCTSRVATKLPGERRVQVGPLSTDDGVTLFLGRAAVRPRDADLPLVRKLVDELEGMPLAIELCAARTGQLDVRALLKRTDDRLKLLAGDDRQRPERHRSVQASLEGSWDLLPAWGRDALARLSVFEGGFTADAAEAVLGQALADGRLWAVDALDALCDASLVRYDASADRFGMLAVVQAFAAEQLDPAARARAELEHGRWYAQLGAPEALDALRVHGGAEREARLATELDNVLAAHARAVARGDAPIAAATARAAEAVMSRKGPFTTLRRLLVQSASLPGLSEPERLHLELLAARALSASGRPHESRPELELVLRRVEGRHPELETRVLCALAGDYLALGDNALAEVTGQRALELARGRGDRLGEIAALRVVGNAIAYQPGDRDGERWFVASLELARAVGDRRAEGAALGALGNTLHRRGRFDDARRAMLRALAIHRETGDRVAEASRLSILGLLEKDHGRVDEALKLYGEALRLERELGNRAEEQFALGCIGYLHLELGDPDACEQPLWEATRIALELSDKAMAAQWEAAVGRWHALRGRREDAARAIRRAEEWLEGSTADYRVWVQAGRAEVELRGGDRAAASATLDRLEAWLARRRPDRNARPWKEIARVRALLG